jgi:hypothetical protein
VVNNTIMEISMEPFTSTLGTKDNTNNKVVTIKTIMIDQVLKKIQLHP